MFRKTVVASAATVWYIMHTYVEDMVLYEIKFNRVADCLCNITLQFTRKISDWPILFTVCD
jgi:hypothetical protein